MDPDEGVPGALLGLLPLERLLTSSRAFLPSLPLDASTVYLQGLSLPPRLLKVSAFIPSEIVKSRFLLKVNSYTGLFFLVWL